MKQIVIFFVPIEATQQDFESVLCEPLASPDCRETALQAKADGDAVSDNDQWPLWTWFVPNPCR